MMNGRLAVGIQVSAEFQLNFSTKIQFFAPERVVVEAERVQQLCEGPPFVDCGASFRVGHPQNSGQRAMVEHLHVVLSGNLSDSFIWSQDSTDFFWKFHVFSGCLLTAKCSHMCASLAADKFCLRSSFDCNKSQPWAFEIRQIWKILHTSNCDLNCWWWESHLLEGTKMLLRIWSSKFTQWSWFLVLNLSATNPKDHVSGACFLFLSQLSWQHCLVVKHLGVFCLRHCWLQHFCF